MNEPDDRLWARRPRGRHADLYDAEYAKQLERIARIRSEVSASLPDGAPGWADAVEWDPRAEPGEVTERRDGEDDDAGGADDPAGGEPASGSATAGPGDLAERGQTGHGGGARGDSADREAPRGGSATSGPGGVAERDHTVDGAGGMRRRRSDAGAPGSVKLRRLRARWDAAPPGVPPSALPPPRAVDAPAPPSSSKPRLELREGGGEPIGDERMPRFFMVDAPPADDPPEPPAAPQGPTRGPRRRSARLVGAAAVAALLAAGLPLLLAGRGSESPAATVFRVPGQPTGLVAADGKVWVAGPAAGAVWVLDGASGKPAAPTLNIDGTPERIALEPRFAWIADTERSSVVRAPRDGTGALRSFRAGPDLSDVTVAAGTVWTASSADGTVRTLDTEGGERVLQAGVRPIALAADARRVVVLDAVGALIAFDAVTRRETGPPIDFGGAPVAVALVGDVAWVADARAGTVRAIELATGRRRAPVAVGRGPVALAADAAGVFVLCRGDRTLVRLDPNGGVRDRITLDDTPTALALDPRHIWIAAGTNEVIRVDR